MGGVEKNGEVERPTSKRDLSRLEAGVLGRSFGCVDPFLVNVWVSGKMVKSKYIMGGVEKTVKSNVRPRSGTCLA